MNSVLDWRHILVRRLHGRLHSNLVSIVRRLDGNPHRWRPASRPVLLREAFSGPLLFQAHFRRELLGGRRSRQRRQALQRRHVVRSCGELPWRRRAFDFELGGLRQATGIFRNSTRQREKPLEIKGVHPLLIILQLELRAALPFSVA